jgi:hypothetical protein
MIRPLAKTLRRRRSVAPKNFRPISKTAVTRPMFDSEEQFVDQFVVKLAKGRTCYGSVAVTTEWDHRAGIVDVLARDREHEIVAFEAKLTNWRRALDQAYRNTAYASQSYVLLPPDVARRALSEREEFKLRGIGICSFDGRRVDVLIAADKQVPLLGWVQRRAHQHFDSLSYDERRPTRSPRRREGHLRPS